MFIVVGKDASRSNSTDGKQWSTPETGEENLNLTSVAIGNGKAVAIGKRGPINHFFHSNNGSSWDSTSRKTGYGGGFQTVSFGNNKFLAFGGNAVTVGKAEPFIAESSDGSEWSDDISIDGKFMIRRAAYGNDRWVGVGDRGRISVCSGNLKKWEDVPDVKAIDTMIDVTFGAGVFVGTGLHGLRRWSKDGKKWSDPEKGKEGEHINSVVWTGSAFVAVGQGATFASPDGKTWERRENTNAPTFFAYDDRKFVGIAWKGRILYSEDSITWEDVEKSDYAYLGITAGSLG